MVLETLRLVLAPWQLSDCERFRPIATDPEVTRHINGGIPWTDEQIRTFVQRQIDFCSEKGYCRWKLRLHGAVEVIGFCGVGLWQDVPEIGWWLARKYWGRGLATEAARAALDDVFRRSPLEEVISVARAANVASIRIMEKLSLTKDRVFERGGVSSVCYSITRSRYCHNKADELTA